MTVSVERRMANRKANAVQSRLLSYPEHQENFFFKPDFFHAILNRAQHPGSQKGRKEPIAFLMAFQGAQPALGLFLRSICEGQVLYSSNF